MTGKLCWKQFAFRQSFANSQWKLEILCLAWMLIARSIGKIPAMGLAAASKNEE